MLTVVSDGLNLFEMSVKDPKKIFLKEAGILATLIGIVSTFPIIVTVFKTKITKNFPWGALILALTSNFLWMVFGYFNNVNASLLQGSLYFIFYGYVAFVKFFNPKLG